MALVLGKQVRVESELAHPTHESFAIGGIPCSPAGHSALFVQLVERLSKGQQLVGGRSEAELPVRLDPFPLDDQVEAQAAGAPCRFEQRTPAGQHEPESRDAFDTLVGLCNVGSHEDITSARRGQQAKEPNGPVPAA